jgi:peptide deformylase
MTLDTMTKLAIRIIPDPVLRQMAKPVPKVTSALAQLMDDMLTSMYAADGLGLAANQVGRLERIIVCDRGEMKRETALRMANPEILSASEELYTHREGCLSIPEQFAEISRPKRIRVGYLDQTGERQELEAEDLLAICIQHEIDHLNGILFFDHISRIKRDMMIRKVEKARKLVGERGFYPDA